jgi:branched-chain amino acid transport system permease protein
MGIHTTLIRVIAFALGAAIAGIAGVLDAHYMFYIDSHNYSFLRSVEMLLFLILGGSEVIWGPILGALILTALPELLRFLHDYRMIFYGFLMMFMMIIRPQGLLDRKLFMAGKSDRG